MRGALLWAACIGGALPEYELCALAAASGLEGGLVLERFDCFAATPTSSKVAADLQVQAVNFVAYKARSTLELADEVHGSNA